MTSEEENTYRLVISCKDQVGVVAAVSENVASHNGWLLESNYFSDAETGFFYMRNEIRASSLAISLEEFRKQFEAIAQQYEMRWTIRDAAVKQRVVILVSHASHCLADLLHRWHSGELDCDIPCVISNHENLRSMVEWHGIPYVCIPMTAETKPQAFAELDSVIEKYAADTIVLARFMQIIPPDMCRKYQGLLINIHHSFLPSFVGANPYQKAFDRGVKLIGATSHYVTEDLDEGPIIEQDVARVGHRHNRDDLVRLGKDVEKSVLARALRYHLEDRVIRQGLKTIVFD